AKSASASPYWAASGCSAMVSWSERSGGSSGGDHARARRRDPEAVGLMCAARLEAIGITKRFFQERLDRYTTALEELDLAVETGEFVRLGRASGRGGTTPLQILDRLIPPT